MGVSIKNAETEKLIRELAQLTGESLTDAVTIALEERLQRVPNDRIDLAERLRPIGREAAPHFRPGFSSGDHVEMLYDEHGLPR